MAQIARRIGVPHATVRNYFRGRLPSPDVLIKIANETDVSLTWLLIGRGPQYLSHSPAITFDDMLERKIEEMIATKLRQTDALTGSAYSLPKPFDFYASLRLTDDPHEVMSAWFAHEGRSYPRDFGVAFFNGWGSFSPEEKIDAIRDAKKVLDRTMKPR